MTSSQANKWAQVFELLSDYRALLIVVHIMEVRDYVPLREIAKVAKTSESKARYYCEKFDKEYIFDEEKINDEAHYKMTNGQQANYVEAILEKLT
jgi:RIO-like serine/threonine protein kinase